MPWIRTSSSDAAIRGGNAPTAGMNIASTVPKTAATIANCQMCRGATSATAAIPKMITHRVASLTMATGRGPNRSATTPPNSRSMALGSAPAAMTRPACEGPATCVAAQVRLRKYTRSPVTEAV
nr:hypothetical protein [Mangrovihabitans endophyticus]